MPKKDWFARTSSDIETIWKRRGVYIKTGLACVFTRPDGSCGPEAVLLALRQQVRGRVPPPV